MQLSERFRLNAFTLVYYDFKIKVFYSYLHHYGTNPAMSRNYSNFHILFNCIVMNSIFRKCYYITFTCSISFITFWYFQNDLANGAKFRILPPDLGFQCLSGFFF